MRYLDNQNHRDGKYDGCQGLGGGKMGSECLVGIDCQFYKMKRVLGMDGGDDCTTL